MNKPRPKKTQLVYPKSNRIIGIDIGLSGGIAVCERGKFIATYAMPVRPAKPGLSSQHRLVCVPTLMGILSEFNDAIVVLESPQLRAFGQAVGSFAVSWHNCGLIMGALDATNIHPYFFVPAQTWTPWVRSFSAKGLDGKEATASGIERLHPEVKQYIYGPRKGLLDGISDAAGIAAFIAFTSGMYETWKKDSING